MAVLVITGNIGAGKTKYCMNDIGNIRRRYPEKRCIMIVPSHYSHETEKMFADEFGGTGLNNTEVTTFEKLARELTGYNVQKLSAPGKQVLICRAVKMAFKELQKPESGFDRRLVTAVGKPGFVSIAQSLISEFHRYLVDSKKLCDSADKPDSGILRQKLKIAAMISENYDNLLNETDYVDADEDLHRLVEVISGYADKNTCIWIDKFDEFLPQQREVFLALINSGAKITVTFNTCADENDTYYGTLSAIKFIQDCAETEFIHLDGGMSYLKDKPDLYFLMSTWFERSVYEGITENAEIFEARDAYTEIEHVASRILDFVREDRYRFRDISVICGNAESYSHITEAVFDEYNIPYYSDRSIAISDHPIAMQILSVFDVIKSNWNYTSVFRYLRSGFAYRKITGENNRAIYRRFKPEHVDRLENYILKYGICGENQWKRSWSEGYRSVMGEAFPEKEKDDKLKELHEFADNMRLEIIEPILKFCENVKKADKVSDYCRILFEFTEDINLYQGIKTEMYGFAINNASADYQRFGQIWNLMINILDQINTALGEEQATIDEFAEYLAAAMSQCSIRTIPSGVDRVFIGDVEKNRAVNSKINFIVGAVSGTFPTETKTEGFFSNADRESLKMHDINIAPTTVSKNLKLNNSVYKAFAAVTDKICISYPVQNSDGKSCRPAQTVIDIKNKLPNIRIYDDIIVEPTDEKKLYISSPKATLHKLLIHPKKHPLWTHVDNWFKEHGEWATQRFIIDDAKARYSKRRADVHLSAEVASSLYDKVITYSSTSLNTYNDCPFKYFLHYGLDVGERNEYKMNAAEIGTYAHELINELCLYVKENNFDWHEVTEEMCNEFIDEVVEKTIVNMNAGDRNGKEKVIDLFKRMGETVKKAVNTVRKSIVVGEFDIAATEYKVDFNLNDKIRLTGMIDRLDKFERGKTVQYRIIDYKTGGKEFKISDIYNGIDMQPVIYALVMMKLAEANGRNAEITGLYYSNVMNEFARLNHTAQERALANGLAKNTKISGATFVDADEDGVISEESLEVTEHVQYREESSMFFKLGAKKRPTKKNPKPGRNPIKIGGDVRRKETVQALVKHVENKIINMDKDIRSGEISISPLQMSSRDACAYCDYKSVCKFDRDLAEERDYDTKTDYWKKLEEDGE